MRCLACDRILTDQEATRKSLTTDEYIDLCNECFGTIQDDISYSENPEFIETIFDQDEDNADHTDA